MIVRQGRYRPRNFHQFIPLPAVSTISAVYSIQFPSYTAVYSSWNFLPRTNSLRSFALTSDLYAELEGMVANIPPPFLIASLLPTTKSFRPSPLFYQRLTRFVSFTLICLFFPFPLDCHGNGEWIFLLLFFFFFFEERDTAEERFR